jgi:Tfp pilus assembly protein PilO
MNPQVRTLAATIAAGVALLAALWFLAIAPKRSEKTEVDGNLAAQQARLDAANAQVTAYTASRKQFAGLLTELKGLDRAVPARGDISAMLRELQRRAKVRGSTLRLVALKDPSAAASSTVPCAPGAITASGGLSALPFTFEYTGRYFDLLDILKTVRRSVRVTSGDLNVDGRLLTIDGLQFNPASDPKLTKAVLNATAYIAPDGAAAAPQPPATGAVTPAPAATTPAPATPATPGGS